MNKLEAEKKIEELKFKLESEDFDLISKKTIYIKNNISFLKQVIINEQKKEIEKLKEQISILTSSKNSRKQIL